MNDLFMILGLEVLSCFVWADVKEKFIFSFIKVLLLAIIIASSFQLYLYFSEEVLDPFFLIAFVVQTSLLIIAGVITVFSKLIFSSLKSQ